MSILTVEGPDGKLTPAKADADGNLSVAVAGGGAGDASEATLSALNNKIPEPATDTLAGDQPAVPVRLVQADPIATTNADIPFAAALPSPTDNAQVVRVVPTGSQLEAGSVAVIISPDQPSFGVAADATLKTRTVGASTGVSLSAATLSADVHALHVRDTLGATEASLTNIDSKTPALVGGRVPTDGSGVTQPISAVALPLPSGAAQEHATAASPHASRLTDGAAFYKGAVAGDNMGADIRVSSAAVSTTNPVPVRGAETEITARYVRLPQDGFGRTVTVEPTPVLQATFPYGCPGHLWKSYLTGTGTVTTTAASDSLATASTGATSSSIAELSSLSRWTYHAGQAMRLLFTTLFSSPAVGGTQAVGVGPYEGYAIGYNGTAFGLLHRRGGVAEIRTLTVTTKSTTTQNATVTLDGVAVSVSITNVGAPGTTVDTAREIAAADYSAVGPGWNAYQFGSTVIFVAKRPGARSGSYSLTATTAVGTFAQTIAGVSPTDTWHAKTAWTGDRLDGSNGANNASGMTLDPTKIAVWQILIPYLGAGNVVLQAMDPTTGQWTTCHTIQGPNTLTSPTLNNPSFNLWIYATGAANISASSASLALFCDGRTSPLGPRVAIGPTFKTTVGNASELPLLSIRVEPVLNGATNRSGFVPLELATSAQATGQVLLRAYLNPTSLPGCNFAAVNAFSGLSYDTSATSVTGGLLVSNVITSPSGGSTPFPLTDLNYKLEAGDVVTITAQQTTGTNGTVAVALTGLEETGTG